MSNATLAASRHTMSRRRITLQLCTLVAAVVLAKGCGDGGDPAEPEPPRPTTVTVSPLSPQLTAVGASVQLSVRVLDQNGQEMTAANVTWSSNNTAVATVNATGLVTAVANGIATITATAGPASSTATVTVAQAVAMVAVAPATATLLTGDTLRLVAEAFDENAHRMEGAEFNWSSSDSSVATVDGVGVVRGVAEGVASVTATAGSARGTAEITVVPRRKPGPGLGIFDFPMRAIAVSGYWGTNREVVQPLGRRWPPGACPPGRVHRLAPRHARQLGPDLGCASLRRQHGQLGLPGDRPKSQRPDLAGRVAPAGHPRVPATRIRRVHDPGFRGS